MIFNIPSLSAVVLLALASVGSVAAAPSPFDYPEVIPGPGMPSLASLGLTSKDLYEGTSPANKRDLMTRFTRICTDNGCGRVPRGDAQACINYLRNLGTQGCGVPPGQDNIVMCTAGAAVVSGSNVGGGSGGSVPTGLIHSSDVAIGGQNVIDNCTDGNNNVAGADAANGNGNLIISIERC